VSEVIGCRHDGMGQDGRGALMTASQRIGVCVRGGGGGIGPGPLNCSKQGEA
jgi:hypothetical protein